MCGFGVRGCPEAPSFFQGDSKQGWDEDVALQHPRGKAAASGTTFRVLRACLLPKPQPPSLLFDFFLNICILQENTMLLLETSALGCDCDALGQEKEVENSFETTGAEDTALSLHPYLGSAAGPLLLRLSARRAPQV